MWPVELRHTHACWARVYTCAHVGEGFLLKRTDRQADFSCRRWKRAGHQLKSMSASWCMSVFLSTLGQRITTAALWLCVCVGGCVCVCAGMCLELPRSMWLQRCSSSCNCVSVNPWQDFTHQQQTHPHLWFQLGQRWYERNDLQFYKKKMYSSTRSVENNQSDCASMLYIIDLLDRLNDQSI